MQLSSTFVMQSTCSFSVRLAYSALVGSLDASRWHSSYTQVKGRSVRNLRCVVWARCVQLCPPPRARCLHICNPRCHPAVLCDPSNVYTINDVAQCMAPTLSPPPQPDPPTHKFRVHVCPRAQFPFPAAAQELHSAGPAAVLNGHSAWLWLLFTGYSYRARGSECSGQPAAFALGCRLRRQMRRRSASTSASMEHVSCCHQVRRAPPDHERQLHAAPRSSSLSTPQRGHSSMLGSSLQEGRQHVAVARQCVACIVSVRGLRGGEGE